MKKLILTTVTFFLFLSFSQAYNPSYYYMFGLFGSSNSNYNSYSYYDSSVSIKKNDSFYETKYLHRKRHNLSKDEIKELILNIQTLLIITLVFGLFAVGGYLFSGKNPSPFFLFGLCINILLFILSKLYLYFNF